MTHRKELQEQRRRLAQWLCAWELEQVLRAADAQETAGREEAPSAGPSLPAEGEAGANVGRRWNEPRVGQIRLLCPHAGGPMPERPVYVAVLARTESGRFLVAPFGRFTQPALPGEWRTGLRPMALHVLCLWNAREVEEEDLRRSWVTAWLDEAKVARAMEVWRFVRHGTALVRVHARDIGPPVRHPLDPRLAYRAQEAILMDEQFPGDSEPRDDYESDEAGEKGVLTYPLPSSTLRKAAETRADYGRRPKKKGRRPS